MIRLHTYFRSSAAYRVRIALELKSLPWEAVPIHLGKGEHLRVTMPDVFGLVPVLEIDGQRLSQSTAIIEYLETRHPLPSLLPSDEVAKASARALSQFIACEIHPLNNLRALKYLRETLALSEPEIKGWYRHWCTVGLGKVEQELQRNGRGRYAMGDEPTIVECFLIPQVYNARRFDVGVDMYPRISALCEQCNALPAFVRAHPSNQVDAE